MFKLLENKKNLWFNQNNQALLRCINENPKKDKFAYIDRAKKDFKVYRFEHVSGQEKKSIYVIVLSKKDILYRRKDHYYEKRDHYKTEFANFRKSFKKQMVQPLTDEKISSLVKEYSLRDIRWRYRRVKVERAFLAVRKINNRLIKANAELCIKKRHNRVKYLKREINYVQQFGIMYSGYKPQWLLWDEFKDAGYVRILMPYFGEDLLLALKKIQIIDNNTRKNIVYAIAVKLKKIHDKGVVHGDLKPNNILMDKNKKVYIIDFDNTAKEGRKMWDKRIKDYIKLDYLYAPLFVFDKSVTKYTKAFDIFSLGVVIWQIYGGDCCGYRFTLSECHEKKNYKNAKEELIKSITKTLQKEAKVDDKITNLVIKMTTAKHDDAPNIDEVIKHLKP